MVVKRIVADIEAGSVHQVSKFYSELFDLKVAMDQGWIVTLATGDLAPVQVSIASEGGNGTPVPSLSIEVDDVDLVHSRAKQFGHEIVYELTDEPWGVRRFFVKDPVGNTINVLSHMN